MTEPSDEYGEQALLEMFRGSVDEAVIRMVYGQFQRAEEAVQVLMEMSGGGKTPGPLEHVDTGHLQLECSGHDAQAMPAPPPSASSSSTLSEFDLQQHVIAELAESDSAGLLFATEAPMEVGSSDGGAASAYAPLSSHRQKRPAGSRSPVFWHAELEQEQREQRQGDKRLFAGDPAPVSAADGHTDAMFVATGGALPSPSPPARSRHAPAGGGGGGDTASASASAPYPGLPTYDSRRGEQNFYTMSRASEEAPRWSERGNCVRHSPLPFNTVDLEQWPGGAPPKKMYILRGLPGSGKSTLARKLCGGTGKVVSADDYFMRNGRYEYDPAKIGKAHDWCQQNAQSLIEEGRSPVIVDNTNTQLWEMKRYAEMASEAGYEIDIQEPRTDWRWNARELAKRNAHGVDAEKIQKMKSRYCHNATVDDVLGSTAPRKAQRSRPSDQQRSPRPSPSRHGVSSAGATSSAAGRASARDAGPGALRGHARSAAAASAAAASAAATQDTAQPFASLRQPAAAPAGMSAAAASASSLSVFHTSAATGQPISPAATPLSPIKMSGPIAMASSSTSPASGAGTLQFEDRHSSAAGGDASVLLSSPALAAIDRAARSQRAAAAPAASAPPDSRVSPPEVALYADRGDCAVVQQSPVLSRPFSSVLPVPVASDPTAAHPDLGSLGRSSGAGGATIVDASRRGGSAGDPLLVNSDAALPLPPLVRCVPARTSSPTASTASSIYYMDISSPLQSSRMEVATTAGTLESVPVPMSVQYFSGHATGGGLQLSDSALQARHQHIQLEQSRRVPERTLPLPFPAATEAASTVGQRTAAGYESVDEEPLPPDYMQAQGCLSPSGTTAVAQEISVAAALDEDCESWRVLNTDISDSICLTSAMSQENLIISSERPPGSVRSRSPSRIRSRSPGRQLSGPAGSLLPQCRLAAKFSNQPRDPTASLSPLLLERSGSAPLGALTSANSAAASLAGASNPFARAMAMSVASATSMYPTLETGSSPGAGPVPRGAASSSGPVHRGAASSSGPVHRGAASSSGLPAEAVSTVAGSAQASCGASPSEVALDERRPAAAGDSRAMDAATDWPMDCATSERQRGGSVSSARPSLTGAGLRAGDRLPPAPFFANVTEEELERELTAARYVDNDDGDDDANADGDDVATGGDIDADDNMCRDETETNDILFLVEAFPDHCVVDLLTALRRCDGDASTAMMGLLDEGERRLRDDEQTEDGAARPDAGQERPTVHHRQQLLRRQQQQQQQLQQMEDDADAATWNAPLAMECVPSSLALPTGNDAVSVSSDGSQEAEDKRMAQRLHGQWNGGYQGLQQSDNVIRQDGEDEVRVITGHRAPGRSEPILVADDSHDTIVMEMSNDMALCLQLAFGAVGFEAAGSNLKFVLNKGTARRLYNNWQSSIKTRLGNEESVRQQQLHSDAELARQLMEHERLVVNAPQGVALQRDPLPSEASGMASQSVRRSRVQAPHMTMPFRPAVAAPPAAPAPPAVAAAPAPPAVAAAPAPPAVAAAPAPPAVAAAAARPAPSAPMEDFPSLTLNSPHSDIDTDEWRENRQRLHDRYPSLSKDVLDAVLDSNDGDLGAACDIVSASLSEPSERPVRAARRREVRQPEPIAAAAGSSSSLWPAAGDDESSAPAHHATTSPALLAAAAAAGHPDAFRSAAAPASAGAQPMRPVVPSVSDPAIARPSLGGATSTSHARSSSKRGSENEAYDKDVQSLENPDYRDFRAEAMLYRGQYQDCVKKSRQEYTRGNGTTAAYLSQRGRKYYDNWKEAEKRAAEMIFAAKNPVDRVEDQIDLHGLHVDESLERLEQILTTQEAAATGRRYIMVCTGRGNHSAGKRPKLKPAVETFLRQKNYHFEYVNAGLVKVHLKAAGAARSRL